MFDNVFNGTDLAVYLGLFSLIYLAHQAGWTR